MSRFKRGLIVSCQALEGEPLHGFNIMPRMAVAAEVGGAIGFRLNGVEDIVNVSKISSLPKIGIIKSNYDGYDVYITPTIKELEELIKAKPEVIAVDCTNRKRPEFDTPKEHIEYIKKHYDVCLMADISTYEEGVKAWEAGADIIATTLCGYTSYTKDEKVPNFDLIKKLVEKVDVPVIAEGNIITPEHAVEALKAGAHAVVVGGAITRPQLITKRFSSSIKEFLD